MAQHFKQQKVIFFKNWGYMQHSTNRASIQVCSKLWMLSFSTFQCVQFQPIVTSCLSFLYSCTKCTKCRYVASLGQLFLQKPWVGQGKLAWTLPKLRLLTLEPLTHASPNLNWKESNVEYRNCTDQTSKIRWVGKSSVPKPNPTFWCFLLNLLHRSHLSQLPISLRSDIAAVLSCEWTQV